ncbi:hypothetical protein JCM11491_002548 [Sporobolomyces phaffii]
MAAPNNVLADLRDREQQMVAWHAQVVARQVPGTHNPADEVDRIAALQAIKRLRGDIQAHEARAGPTASHPRPPPAPGSSHEPWTVQYFSDDLIAARSEWTSAHAPGPVRTAAQRPFVPRARQRSTSFVPRHLSADRDRLDPIFLLRSSAGQADPSPSPGHPPLPADTRIDQTDVLRYVSASSSRPIRASRGGARNPRADALRGEIRHLEAKIASKEQAIDGRKQEIANRVAERDKLDPFLYKEERQGILYRNQQQRRTLKGRRQTLAKYKERLEQARGELAFETGQADGA